MQNRYILFGAGQGGRRALKAFGKDNVVCFCDNSLFGGKVGGKDVISFKVLHSMCEDNIVIITPRSENAKKEISKQLADDNIKYAFLYDELMRVNPKAWKRYFDDNTPELIKKARFIFEGSAQYVAVLTNPFYFLRKNLYLNIKEFAPCLSGCVMDFGCGSKPYETLFSHCKKYFGCDIEQSGHNHDGENIDVYYNGHNIPITEGELGGILTSSTLEHIFNLDEILDEFNRVLKPGGYILMTVPFVWNEHEVPYDCVRYTSFGIRQELEQHGFEIVVSKKITTYIEMLFQMAMEYVRFTVASLSKSHFVNVLFQVLLISPLCVCGILLNKLLPENDSWYGDNILLARKIEDKGTSI